METKIFTQKNYIQKAYDSERIFVVFVYPPCISPKQKNVCKHIMMIFFTAPNNAYIWITDISHQKNTIKFKYCTVSTMC